MASIPTGSTNPIYTFTAPSGSFSMCACTRWLERWKARPRTKSGSASTCRMSPSAPANLIGMANGSSIALAWRNTFAGGAAGRRGPGRVGVAQRVTPARADRQLPVQRGARRHLHAVGARRQRGGQQPRVQRDHPHLPGHDCLARVRRCRRRSSWPTGSATPSTSCGIPRPDGAGADVVRAERDGSFNGASAPGRRLSGAVGPGTYTLNVAATNPCGMSAATSGQTVVVP